MKKSLINRRITGGGMVFVGVLLCILGMAADIIGLGSEAITFGWKQWLSLISGIFLCIIGSLIVFHQPIQHYVTPFYRHLFVEPTTTYIQTHRRRLMEGTVLSIILMMAAAARIIRSHFGLPYLHVWDEPQTASTALQMLRTGDYNPHFFHYGSLSIYLSLIVDILHYFYLMALSSGSSVLRDLNDIQINLDTGYHWTISHPSFYLWNRWLIAGMGTVSVGIIYYLAKKMGGILAGVVAAIFLAGLSIHIEHSTFNTPDLPVSFFILCTAACLILFFERNRPFYFLIALICAGFAASVKYNSVIVLVLPLTGLIYAWRVRCQGYRRWSWFALPVIPALAFLIGTPYALIDLTKFLRQAGFELYHYRVAGHDSYATVEPGWVHAQLQLSNFHTTLGIIGTIGCLVGLVYLTTQRYGRLLLIYLVITFIAFTRTTVSFHRNFILFYPFFAIAIGCGASLLYRVVHLFVRQRIIWQQRMNILLLLAAMGGSIYWLSMALQQSWNIGMTPESRTQAISYVQRLIQDDSRTDIKVGIASELRIHPSDLQRLGALGEVAPYQQLICYSDDYTYILGPGGDERMQNYLKSYTTHHAVFGTMPVRSRGILVNPAVTIIEPDHSSPVLPQVCSQTILPEDLQHSLEYTITNGNLAMWWNGKAETPRFDTEPGTYIFGWHAHGRSAGGQFAQLKATVLSYDAQGEEATTLVERVDELTQDLHPYTLVFTLAERSQIALQLEFLNDGTDSSGNDRNAFIGRIRLTSIHEPIPLDMLSGEYLGQQEGIQPYSVENGILRLHTNATIALPSIPLTAGKYAFLWEASGELFNDEYSKIQVRVMETQDGRSPHVENIVELSTNMESYSLPFHVSKDSTVTLQVTSVSDAVRSETGEGYNVYMSNVRVIPMSETIALNSDISEYSEQTNSDMFWVPKNGAVQTPALSLNPGSYEWRWYDHNATDTPVATRLKATVLIVEDDVIKPLQEHLIELKPHFQEHTISFYIHDIHDPQSIMLQFAPETSTNTTEPTQDHVIKVGYVRMQQTSHISLASLSAEPYYFIDHQGIHMTPPGKIATPPFDIAPGRYRFLWSPLAIKHPEDSETLLLREALVTYATNGDKKVLKERVIMIPPGDFSGYLVLPFTLNITSRISLQLEFMNGVVLNNPNYKREIIIEEVRFEQIP